MAETRPNVLIAVSDDQSFPHASAYGYAAINTPAFDDVAKSGVLFRNAFTPAPGCSPMRAAFLTGRYIWQIEHAGTHASSFSKKYVGFQTQLEQAGYFVGYTGKGWGPGNFKVSGRTRNPAGPSFSKKKLKAPAGIRNTDYAGNFAEFLKQRPKGKPFSFWFGGSEPHRSFKKGIGIENGMDPAKVVVPRFLPDTPEIRSDILDYCYEIQWFDSHLGRMLKMLKEIGELENTLVIVTSDNGMAFPRAKANVYEYGIHMPLAISFPKICQGDRVVDDVVNLIDVTATIYEATNVEPPGQLSGRSMMNILASTKSGRVDETRKATFSGRERHSSSRFNSLGYPQRCVRTDRFLYVRNLRPERWPAGTPRKYGPAGKDDSQHKLGPEHGGYHDIDACPSLTFLIQKANDPAYKRFLDLAVAKRPEEELFDITIDPDCLNNLAEMKEHAAIKEKLSQMLMAQLRKTEDPRIVSVDKGDIFETYPRYSRLRWFPTPQWAKDNPGSVPKQPWLEKRRPK